MHGARHEGSQPCVPTSASSERRFIRSGAQRPGQEDEVRKMFRLPLVHVMSGQVVAFLELRGHDNVAQNMLGLLKKGTTGNDLADHLSLRPPPGTHILTGGTKKNPWKVGLASSGRLRRRHTDLNANNWGEVSVVRLIPRFERPSEEEPRWLKNREALQAIVLGVGGSFREVEFPYHKASPKSGTIYVPKFWTKMGLVVTGLVSFPGLNTARFSDHRSSSLPDKSARPNIDPNVYSGQGVPPPGMVTVEQVIRAGKFRQSMIGGTK